MKLVFYISILNYLNAYKNRCRKYKVDCVPNNPICQSSNSSGSDSSSSNTTSSVRNPSIRDNTDQYIQLIQGVLLQLNFNMEKYARWYTEELKNGLLSGIELINKSDVTKLNQDLTDLEQKIINLSEHYNDEIYRELDDLIRNTNLDLQNSVLKLLKLSNGGIVKALTDAATNDQNSTIDPIVATNIINKGFKDLLEELTQLLSRVTNAELSSVNKIVEDKLYLQLTTIEKLLSEFNRKVESYFKDLNQETISLVNATIDVSTRRFISNIEELIKKVGYNIVSVLKGCNVEFNPPVLTNRLYDNNNEYRKYSREKLKG